jgi:hypothetical protein
LFDPSEDEKIIKNVDGGEGGGGVHQMVHWWDRIAQWTNMYMYELIICL